MNNQKVDMKEDPNYVYLGNNGYIDKKLYGKVIVDFVERMDRARQRAEYLRTSPLWEENQIIRNE